MHGPPLHAGNVLLPHHAVATLRQAEGYKREILKCSGSCRVGKIKNYLRDAVASTAEGIRKVWKGGITVGTGTGAGAS